MSKIEWCDRTINPVVGCTRVSKGCENCYAEKMAGRGILQQFPQYQEVNDGGKWNHQTAFVASELEKPLRWRKPRRIFVCSMGDLFHESVPDEWIHAVVDVARRCPQHTFQLLTKRPERFAAFFDAYPAAYVGNPLALPSNIWLGVSVEDQATADERIPLLLRVPAAVRFVSAEPLLGPIAIDRYLSDWWHNRNSGVVTDDGPVESTGRLAWLICGGESGPGARPMHPDWARGLRDQCQEAGVAFFLKQNGEFADSGTIPASGVVEVAPGYEMIRVGKKQAGRELDGRTWEECPDG